jgi:predicted ATPase
MLEWIIARCPNVAVLATSREHLHVPGERVWQVAPLAVPSAGASAGEVLDTPAGALFCARAVAVEPAFALTDGNAPAVGELCRRLDGIPLAIELAAARVRAMTPADLVERLDQRFRLLTVGPRRDEGRHRTLQAVVAWSYELLGEAEAPLFDRLPVFAGSFALSAAERVCAGEPVAEEDVAGVLAELVDKSMVVVERGEDRACYRLLDTLRDYGSAQLEEAGDAERYRRAHAAQHVALSEALGPRVRGTDEGATKGAWTIFWRSPTA